MATEKYIATEALFIGRSRAHNAGDEVPAANIEPNGWADKVARQGTAAAEAAPGAFDPAQHDVDSVLAHLAESADDERDRVLAAEQAGKARKTILEP